MRMNERQGTVWKHVTENTSHIEWREWVDKNKSLK